MQTEHNAARLLKCASKNLHVLTGATCIGQRCRRRANRVTMANLGLVIPVINKKKSSCTAQHSYSTVLRIGAWNGPRWKGKKTLVWELSEGRKQNFKTVAAILEQITSYLHKMKSNKLFSLPLLCLSFFLIFWQWNCTGGRGGKTGFCWWNRTKGGEFQTPKNSHLLLLVLFLRTEQNPSISPPHKYQHAGS